MSQPELLIKIIDFLELNKIEYMVTGSVVSSLQGEPRTTHDIDIVVSISKTTTAILIESFQPPRYYLSQDAIEDAINRSSMFNLVDTSGGDKVDFWLLTDDAFDKVRFKRKYKEDFPGIAMFVSRPEDTILMKLRWAKLSGGSEKQFLDACRVYELQYNILDVSYMNQWVEYLSINEEWEKLKEKAAPLY